MKKHVLLVEDSFMMSRFLAHHLELNYQVSTVAAPLDALLWLKTNAAPDAILLDYDLPEMTGLDMLHHLKKKQEWSDIPVIMVSGVKSAEKRIECLEAGASDFIAKPFHPKELSLRLRRYISSEVELLAT